MKLKKFNTCLDLFFLTKDIVLHAYRKIICKMIRLYPYIETLFHVRRKVGNSNDFARFCAAWRMLEIPYADVCALTCIGTRVPQRVEHAVSAMQSFDPPRPRPILFATRLVFPNASMRRL